MVVNFKYPKKRRIKVRLDDFDKSIDKSRDESFYAGRVSDSYNFRLSSGALTDGFGIKDYLAGENCDTVVMLSGETIENVYYYKKFDNDDRQKSS